MCCIKRVVTYVCDLSLNQISHACKNHQSETRTEIFRTVCGSLLYSLQICRKIILCDNYRSHMQSPQPTAYMREVTSGSSLTRYCLISLYTFRTLKWVALLLLPPKKFACPSWCYYLLFEENFGMNLWLSDGSSDVTFIQSLMKTGHLV
jgi:hypothetical protein